MKAAVLLVRLAKNHALPDGNKRTALATTIAFCDVNGYDWTPSAGDDPTARKPSSACRPSPRRLQRTWRRSRPRSPAGSRAPAPVSLDLTPGG
jgi:prophage maintenance system killer protein